MVYLLCGTATAGYICRVNVATAAPLLMQEFSLSQIAMGRIFSAFLLGYAICQIPAGALADRWGTRSVLAKAAWLWAGFTFLQASIGWGPISLPPAYSLFSLVLFRFLLGVSASPTYPASAAGISRWMPGSAQGRANGIVIASVGLGSAIAPPLVSHMMIGWGWRSALLVTALPALLIAMIWKGTREPDGGPEKESNAILSSIDPGHEVKTRLWTPGFILLTISYSLQGYVGYIFVSWFYIYLVQVRHFSLLAGGWIGSLPWVLSIISMPLGGLVADRLSAGKLGPTWGPRIVPICGMALSGILISLGAHTANAIFAAIILALATAMVLCVEGPFWTVMTRFAGAKSGQAGGVMNMGSNIGGLLSPAITPILAAAIGWENALHLAASFAILAAVLWCWISPPPWPPREESKE